MNSHNAAVIWKGLIALLFLGACIAFGILAYQSKSLNEATPYIVAFGGLLGFCASAARSFAEILLKSDNREQEGDEQ